MEHQQIDAIRTQAWIDALTNQRNASANDVVKLSGELAALTAENTALKAQVDALQTQLAQVMQSAKAA